MAVCESLTQFGTQYECFAVCGNLAEKSCTPYSAVAPLQILEAWLGRVGGAEPRRVPAAHLYLLHLSYSQMRIPGGTVRTALDESADHPARCGRVR